MLIALATQSKGQVNLVPNGSFEDTTHCPGYFENISTAVNWFQPTRGTPDLFSTCYVGGVPNNYFGYQQPKDGAAYVGAFSYINYGQYDEREYLAVKLLDSLKGDMNYCFRMYVSVSNKYRWPISSIGAYFSPDSINLYTYSPLPYFPQIENDSNNFINYTTNWQLISGSFKAQGGEHYLYIGNFRDSTNTICQSYAPYHTATYIYFDDISLVECEGVGIEENTTPKNAIYPNPAAENVTIALPPNTNKAELLIYTVQGQLLSQTQIADTQTINTSSLANGMYLFVIQLNGNIIEREKIIIAH